MSFGCKSSKACVAFDIGNGCILSVATVHPISNCMGGNPCVGATNVYNPFDRTQNKQKKKWDK